ncbi:MAG: methionyl-tRNA synthetase [Patescibacteria group bacterium]|jgi:methionyl-tRNA synthetase|nr:methionyl-tRNA synthetase [Patescibacteria group bacterium]
MSRPFYITTTLPYVNDKPHVGHALEFVQADALARSRRLRDDEVFFNTGTDEHGQKIYDKAVKEGRDVKEYVDFYAERFTALKEKLNLSYDAFIRTTDEKHIQAAQEIWKRCEAAGDIYKKNYKTKYCVGCELEKTDSELVEGKCPIHLNLELQIVDEENYFFKLSKYKDALLAYLAGDVVTPLARKNDAINFVNGDGFQDFSISRLKEKMSWGIPVPGDESQVMYVWFDALTNYISTLDWPNESADSNFTKYWMNGETLQVAGKDQVRMQSIMWQAMLLSANVPPTQHVFYHGFITSGGQKMSKSLGNVLDPFDYAEEFGIDAVRYFFLRHVHPFEDSDFTRERFVESYNAGLANGLGNLASRVMKMAEEHLTEPVVVAEKEDFTDYFALLDAFKFNEASDLIWQKIAECDALIQESQPFKVVKDDAEKGRALIADLAVRLYTIGRMLNPLMPSTSQIIKDAVKANKKPENMFSRREA